MHSSVYFCINGIAKITAIIRLYWRLKFNCMQASRMLADLKAPRYEYVSTVVSNVFYKCDRHSNDGFLFRNKYLKIKIAINVAHRIIQ